MVLIPDLYTSFFYLLVDILIAAHFSQCFSINRVSLELPLFLFWDFASLGSLMLSNLPLRSPKTSCNKQEDFSIYGGSILGGNFHKTINQLKTSQKPTMQACCSTLNIVSSLLTST